METLDLVATSEGLKQILIHHPFLKALDPAYTQLITDCAAAVDFKAGEEILYEGAAANEFYLIYEGRVALGIYTAGYGFTTIQIIDPGEIVGWSWLMPPHYWHFGAKAIIPTRAIAVNGKYLREKCETDHDFGYELLKRLGLIIGQRLRSTRMQLHM